MGRSEKSGTTVMEEMDGREPLITKAEADSWRTHDFRSKPGSLRVVGFEVRECRLYLVERERVCALCARDPERAYGAVPVPSPPGVL